MMRGRITKKKAAAAFCLCMFCFLLAGCSGDKGGVAINDGSGNLTDDESQPYEIDYWIAVEAAGIPKDLSLVEAEINRIVTKKINATVKLHPVLVGDYENRMQLVVNAGDKFDLCFTSPWMNNYAKNVRLEGFWDITDLLPEYAPKTWALYDERIWSAARVEGRIYGSINRQIMARTPGVTLDRAMYEASGMTQEDFKTLDGFTEFLAYCYNNGADRANITQGYDPQGLIAFFGFDDINGASCPGVVDVSADKPAVINQFESEKFRNALKYSVDWYKKGYIPADALTAAFDFSKSYGLLSSTWKPSQEGEDTLRRKGRASICFPIGPSYMYSNWIHSSMTGVSATSENPIRAIKFIELLNTDKELYNLICYGVEGQHYRKTGENRIEPIIDSGYAVNIAWEFGDQFNSYLLPGYPDDVWEQTDGINDGAEYSPIVGFVFDPEPVRVEISNCEAVFTEFWYPLVSGVYQEKTDERLAAFLSRLKESGADKIIGEMQKQLDAWKAAQ